MLISGEISKNSIVMWRLGQSVALFITIIYVLSSLGFLANFSITSIYFVISFIIIGIFIAYSYIKNNSIQFREFILTFGSFIVILIVSFLFAYSFWDFSIDGQVYRQEMILQLRDGWNPVYVPIISIDGNYTANDLYISHYAKAAEIVAANFAQVLGFVEFGKATNFLLLVASFLLAWAVFTNLFPKKNI